MEVTVWGDLLFFVNFCIDFQCMFLTAKLLRRRFFLWRAAFFSALGAAYAVAALFFSTSGVLAFILDLFVCLLMCVGAFYVKGEPPHAIFLFFFFYFGVSFLIGGAMSGMASLLSRLSLPLGTYGGDNTGGGFFLLAFLGGAVTFLWGNITKRRAATARARLRVEIGARALTLVGVIDTANLLCDPVSHRPVVILSSAVAKKLFPIPFANVFASSDTKSISLLPNEWAKRVRVLPSDSVAGERLLIGVSPDRTFLDVGKGEQAVDVLVAFAPLSLGKGDAEALIPSVLMN